MASDERLAPMFTNLIPVPAVDPDDVARSVPFLASDDSRYVTGHELVPDAGVTEF